MNFKNTLLTFLTVSSLALMPIVTSAHVGYVLDDAQFAGSAGSDAGFLFSGFHDAPGTAMVAGLIGLAVVALIFYVRSRPRSKIFLEACREKLAGYQGYLGWIARLSLGIALIGSGTAQALISPVLADVAATSVLQVLLGFMFLLGFLLTPAYIAAILLFFFGLTQSGYLFGNVDFLALVLAGLLLSNSRPGLDDIVGIRSLKIGEKAKALVPLILRIGLGIAFVFLAVYEKFLNPHGSELVVQLYDLTNVIPVPESLWVLGAGIVELLLGLLLIFGLEVRLVSIVSFFVISLSFFYFKESVYSHITLFGAISMLVVTGAGSYSLDEYLQKRKMR